MARIPIAPPGMKDQRPRYTLGWRVGNHIYVAGQLPFDKDGNLLGKGDIKAQTRRIFEQIKMIVEAGGGKMDDVVKVTVLPGAAPVTVAVSGPPGLQLGPPVPPNVRPSTSPSYWA